MKPIDVIQEKDSSVIVSVPHGSGRIPDEIRHQLRITLSQGPHDVGTRELATLAVQGSATLVMAGFSRIVIDVNRYPEPSETDLHSLLDLEEDRRIDSERLIRTYLGRKRAWKEPLTDKEIRRRIRRYHVPYHEALSREISRIQRGGRPVLLIDLHSTADDTYDFIVGDNGGRSAERTICLFLCRLLSQTGGFDPSRIGYVASKAWQRDARASLSASLLGHTGGFITVNYGNPRGRVFAVQIEISRELFMNTKTGKIREKTFQTLAERMKLFFERLAEACEPGRGEGNPLAPVSLPVDVGDLGMAGGKGENNPR